jgi:hypothetical protein
MLMMHLNLKLSPCGLTGLHLLTEALMVTPFVAQEHTALSTKPPTLGTLLLGT